MPEQREMSTFGVWLAGARPKTLPAAIVPVLVGAACASGLSPVAGWWWRFSLAMIVSLSLQVGVNFANDYSDGVRGTDANRVGPLRLVGSGLVAPGKVKRAAFAAFGCAAVSGLVLAATTSWWLIVVGFCAIVAGWTYTGGPKPYGYLGFGEVFVFVFFGVVATVGSAFVVAKALTSIMWLASVPVGCFACALLVVNNLRDIPTDREAGKKTLAVRMGDAMTRKFYIVLIVLAGIFTIGAGVQRPLAIVGLFGVASALGAIKIVSSGAKGKELIAVLALTGKAQMIFGVTFALGLLVAGF